MKLKLELPYPVSANRIWRNVLDKRGKQRTYLSVEARQYYCSVKRCVKEQVDGLQPFTGAVGAEIILHPATRRKQDTDNRIKSLLDALEYSKVFAEGDAQVTELHVYRRAVIQGGRADVVLWEV